MMNHQLIDEVMRCCHGAEVDKDDWIAIASTLPHVTVRAADPTTRDILFRSLTMSDTLVLAKHGRCDVRATLKL